MTNLGRCALSLVREAERFDGDLVCSFCDATVTEHYKLQLSRDRVFKVWFLPFDGLPLVALLGCCYRTKELNLMSIFFQFVREVLSVLCGFKDKRMSMAVDISMSVLRSLTCHFKVRTKTVASYLYLY